jgi:hypothetical protein
MNIENGSLNNPNMNPNIPLNMNPALPPNMGQNPSQNMNNNMPPNMNSNMMPNQMYPPQFYYPNPYMTAMNQGMMPPYPPMNMGYQYPPGYSMNMPYMNPPNLMENLNNGGNQPVEQSNGNNPKDEKTDENIHKANPLKVIRKASNNQKKIEKSESEEEEQVPEKSPKNDQKEQKSPEKKKEIQRIDFNQSDEEAKETIHLKQKINAIPNEKVEQDVRKKEEIIAKELTENEILKNKVKNQKALEEIKMDKKILKILVGIAKKIPKKKSRLFRQKIKWSELEKVRSKMN